MKIIEKLFGKKSSSYEKWYEKKLKEAKENYVTISKLEFLDAFSSAMAIVGARSGRDASSCCCRGNSCWRNL